MSSMELCNAVSLKLLVRLRSQMWGGLSFPIILRRRCPRKKYKSPELVQISSGAITFRKKVKRKRQGVQRQWAIILAMSVLKFDHFEPSLKLYFPDFSLFLESGQWTHTLRINCPRPLLVFISLCIAFIFSEDSNVLVFQMFGGNKSYVTHMLLRQALKQENNISINRSANFFI